MYDVIVWTHFNGHETCDLRSKQGATRFLDTLSSIFADPNNDDYETIAIVKHFHNGTLVRKLEH